jgi:5-methylcytosine-specific restriction protein A
MPELAPRPCNKLGCRNLSTDSYCIDHKASNSGWNRYHKGKSRHERGYGNAWDKLRKRILKRDMGLCQVCIKEGVYTPAKAVDHIKPKAAGGNDNPINLQSICNECHQIKTQRDSNG